MAEENSGKEHPCDAEADPANLSMANGEPGDGDARKDHDGVRDRLGRWKICGPVHRLTASVLGAGENGGMGSGSGKLLAPTLSLRAEVAPPPSRRIPQMRRRNRLGNRRIQGQIICRKQDHGVFHNLPMLIASLSRESGECARCVPHPCCETSAVFCGISPARHAPSQSLGAFPMGSLARLPRPPRVPRPASRANKATAGCSIRRSAVMR